MKKTVLLAIFVLSVGFLQGEGFLRNESDLSSLAQKLDTDKGPQGHNYVEVYDLYLERFRDKAIKFLEIGIGKGKSVLMWELYFLNAELHFIDNNPATLDGVKSKRIHYHLLDQGEVKSLNKFVSKVGGDFDVVVDDGGHFMHQQITSFKTLFPYLKSGGLYIIEDLHTSYWTCFGGHGSCEDPKAGKGTTIEFLKNLVEDLNYSSAVTGCGNSKRMPSDVTLNEYQKNIHSIHFYKSLCIIQKL